MLGKVETQQRNSTAALALVGVQALGLVTYTAFGWTRHKYEL